MKKLFLLLAVCLSTAVVDAQITTGESSSKVIRTGNRAKAGNFGIYFGATTDIFKNIGDGDVDFSAIPLINLKYMKSDKLEYRLGIEWWKKSESEEAEESEFSTSESQFTFYPGVAYHFSNKNLLDVYVGGELPIGWGSKGWDNGDDDLSASNFRVGLGAFVGLQAYIANLPLALGVEYGVSTMYSKVSDGYMTKDGMTIDYKQDYKENPEEDHDQSKWKLGHQVRVTLSYYFNL